MRPAVCVTRGRRQGHLSPIFWVKEQKRLIGCRRNNEALESQFPKLQTFSESAEPLSRNHDPNMTQSLHVYTICFQPQVVYDVISGRNVKTIDGYPVVIFELASSNGFRDIPKKSFRDGGGSGHRR